MDRHAIEEKIKNVEDALWLFDYEAEPAVAKAVQLAKEWARSSDYIRGKSFEELQQAIEIDKAWYSPFRSSLETPKRLEDAQKLVRKWENLSDRITRKDAREIARAFEHMDHWDRTFGRMDVTPERVMQAQKLLKDCEREPRAWGYGINKHEAEMLVDLWEKSWFLSNMPLQEMQEDYLVVAEWRVFLNRVTPEAVEEARERVRAWREHPLLGRSSPEEITEAVRLAEEWGMAGLSRIGPLEIKKVLTLIEEESLAYLDFTVDFERAFRQAAELLERRGARDEQARESVKALLEAALEVREGLRKAPKPAPLEFFLQGKGLSANISDVGVRIAVELTILLAEGFGHEIPEAKKNTMRNLSVGNILKEAARGTDEGQEK